MYSQSIYSSKKKEDNNPSAFSNKKKISNPALLFSKSGQKGQSSIYNEKCSIKYIIQNENNPSLLNAKKSRSPMRLGSGRQQNNKQAITSQKSSFISNNGLPLNQMNFPENNSFISNQSQRDNHYNQQLQQNDPLTRLTALSRISNIQGADQLIKQSIHFCQNHQTKVASHVSSIDMSNVQYFCQKCAILLASQGYEVLKIGQTQHSDSFISDSSRANSSRNYMLPYIEENEANNSTSMMMMAADNSSFISNKSSRSSKQQQHVMNYNQQQQLNHNNNGNGYSASQSINKNINKSCGKSFNNQTQQSVSQSKNKPNYNSNSERQNEINNFLSSTRDLSDNIMMKKQDIKDSLIQSQEFYGQQIEQVNEYFDLVYQSLELEKNKCYNYILNQRKEVEEPIRMINETMNQLKDKIQSIISDIQENIETVFAAENDVYKLVIGQYQENYAEIQDRICEVQIFPVEMRKIDFEGVPQSIYGLSDILKDSIQNNGQCQNKRKMHEQLNQLRDSLQESLPNIQPKKLFSSKQFSRQEYLDGGPSSVNTVCMSEKQKLYFSFQGDALRNQICEQVELQQDESKIEQRFYCENKNLQSFSD